MHDFKRGDRVRLSKLGKEVLTHHRRLDRHGTVAGRSRKSPDCINVIWDGNKKYSYNCYHESFIEVFQKVK